MLDPLISLDPKEHIPDAPDDTYLRLIGNDLSTLEEALSRVDSDWIPRTKWTDLPPYRTRRFRLVSLLLSRWTRNNTLCRALLYFIVLYSWLNCPHTGGIQRFKDKAVSKRLSMIAIKSTGFKEMLFNCPLTAELYMVECCIRNNVPYHMLLKANLIVVLNGRRLRSKG